MAYTGVIEHFAGNDFEAYQERLEAYFEANDIGSINENSSQADITKADKKKVAHTIAVMGK